MTCKMKNFFSKIWNKLKSLLSYCICSSKCFDIKETHESDSESSQTTDCFSDFIHKIGELEFSIVIFAIGEYLYEMIDEIMDLFYLGGSSGPILGAGQVEKIIRVSAMFYSFDIISNVLSLLAFVFIFTKDVKNAHILQPLVVILIQFNILNIIEYFFIERMLTSLLFEVGGSNEGWTIYVNLTINMLGVAWYVLLSVDFVIASINQGRNK